MRIELGHVRLEGQRNVMHTLDAFQRLTHDLRPLAGLMARLAGHLRGVAGIPGHFLHGGVHLIHGRRGFGKARGRLRGGVVGLLDLGRELRCRGGDGIDDMLQLPGSRQHAVTLGIARLLGGSLGPLHGLL